MENMDLKYYNPEIHKASFVLPEFARKVNCVKIIFACDLYAVSTVNRHLLLFTQYLLDH